MSGAAKVAPASKFGKRLSPEDKEAMLVALRTDETSDSIGERLGISGSAVRLHARKNGIPRPRHIKPLICGACGFSGISDRFDVDTTTPLGRRRLCRDCRSKSEKVQRGSWPPPSTERKLRTRSVVNVSTGCVEWTGSIVKGYPQISIGYKSRRAHRLAWELYNGPIPDGLSVCHHCDNPKCINPGHLFLGTNLDNVRDAISKGRMAFQKKEAKK